MSILLPGQNSLPKPAVLTDPDFEVELAALKTTIIDHVAAGDAEQAAEIALTLDTPTELITKVLEALVIHKVTEARAENERAAQMYALWAKDSNLDAKAADLGLTRQQISPGDAAAFPPVLPVMESNEHLLLRYLLAPHAPAAGSRTQYRHELLTLSDRPHVSVEAVAPNKVVVTYDFQPDSFAGQVKDGAARQTTPGSIECRLLGWAGDGTPSAELLGAGVAHMAREDVHPETDNVSVLGASIKNYQIDAVIWVHPGPDSALAKQAAEQALAAYADSEHRLGGQVEPSWIDHHLHGAGAVKVQITKPAAPVVALWSEAPYCTAINVEVRSL